MKYKTEGLSLDTMFTSRLTLKRIRYLPRIGNSMVVCNDMDGMEQEGITTWHNALYWKEWVESAVQPYAGSHSKRELSDKSVSSLLKPTGRSSETYTEMHKIHNERFIEVNEHLWNLQVI
jgi:hypothetical protein